MCPSSGLSWDGSRPWVLFSFSNQKLSWFDTVVYLGLLLWECQSPAWWWCYLRCSALADGWPLVLPPPLPPLLVGWVYSLAPKWLRARCGWGDPGVAWSRVMGYIFLQPPHFIFHPFHKSSCCHHGAKFSAASTNHFHLLHKSSCCKHHPAPPDYGMPPWDLLPPSAGPLRRGHFVWVFPSQSLPSLVYFPGELVASSLVGWRLRSAPPCMVIVSLPTKSWFHFLVLKQS